MISSFTKRISFHKGYFIIATLLLIIELMIALYVNDDIIRPYLGDALVVVLLNCILNSFLNFGKIKIALSVLIFACSIEFGQYFELVNLLGLEDSAVAVAIIGNTFSWRDLLMYALGLLLVFVAELPFEISTGK